MKLALAQIRCEKGDWPGNVRNALEWMGWAAEQGCDVIIFPEMSLSGYADPARFPGSVQTLDSPWVAEFVRATARHRIAASAGFIEANPGHKPFVTQVLAQGGRIVGLYRKRHIVDEEEALFSPGGESPVFTLTLPEGDLPCALAVCADSDRPSLFEEYGQQGAKIVFHSSAPGLYGRRTDEASWQSGYDWYKGHLAERLPVYARDNHLYIAVSTQTGATADEDFPGGSFIFGPDGTCLAGTSDWSETMLVHDLDIVGDW